jgi:hypothetical protein
MKNHDKNYKELTQNIKKFIEEQNDIFRKISTIFIQQETRSYNRTSADVWFTENSTTEFKIISKVKKV